jgi:hypothetical protein
MNYFERMIASSLRNIEAKEVIEGKSKFNSELQDNLFAEFIKELIKPKLKECSVKKPVEKEEKNCLVKFI